MMPERFSRSEACERRNLRPEIRFSPCFTLWQLELAPGIARYRFGIAQVSFGASFSAQHFSTREVHFDIDCAAET